jgi:large subunit ribosomal protein L21
MYAIVETGGKQYRVQEGAKIVVDRIAAEAGSEVVLDQVLMLGGDSVRIGTPVVEGARVLAKVLEHSRGDKIQVFKKRRRKGSRSMQGHRQDYTSLAVTGISV